YRYKLAEALLELGANPKAQGHYLMRMAARSDGRSNWLSSDIGRRIVEKYYTPEELRSYASDLLGSKEPIDWLRQLDTEQDIRQSDCLAASLIRAFPVEELLQHLPNRKNSQILINLGRLFGKIDLLIPHARSAKARTNLALMML